MQNFSFETETFIAEFDEAMVAHNEWNQRILRCAVLHESPGDDILSPTAHTLCRFGRWFALHAAYFESIDIQTTQRVTFVHQRMHELISAICEHVMTGTPGSIVDLEDFEKSQAEFVILLANLKNIVLSNALRNDPLTGLPLRYGIASDFSLCQKDAERNNSLLYVAMIDIDNFKKVNDTHGHPIGDIILQSTAAILKQVLRSNDPLYRFGGEEFLWFLRCKSSEEASQSASRVVTTIATTPMTISDNQVLSVTITTGLALVRKKEDLDSAIKRADIALYEGKNNGRNQFVIA